MAFSLELIASLSVLRLWLVLMPQDSSVPSTAAQKRTADTSALEEACRLRPSAGDTCYRLATTLLVQDRWEDAREPFEKALRAASGPDRARVHRATAFNYVGLGDTSKAESHFRQAVALNPGPELMREDPRIDYGAFLFRQGRLEEALPLLQQAVRAVPDSSRAHMELGRVLLHLGKHESSRISLEQAVQLDPRSSNARLLLERAKALSSAHGR